MKSKLTILLAVLLLLGRDGQAQGFMNLNFEDAVIIPDPSSPYYPNAVYASDAIPGWTATGFIGPNDIYYDNLTLGAPCVSIVDTNGSFHSLPIDGTYSIVLYGGSGSASISQTATVPAYAESVLFEARSGSGTLEVSLGGQSIPFFALSTGLNYTLYGGNVPSGLSGQSEQLMLSALTGVNNVWTIDDIQFFTSPVPEPSVFAFTAMGGLLFGFRRRRKSRQP